MKLIAVIPVHGRLPLLKVTIERLYKKNGINHVICVGDEDDERKVCHHAGAEFLKHDNKPLGRKWNAGFLHAKQYKPDAIVYVGSSDWLSDNWISSLEPYISLYDIIGKPDFNLLHIDSQLNAGHWPHYQPGTGRENEPIGIGRILNREFLDKIGWQPFDDYLDKAMDYSMIGKLMNIGGKCFLFNSPEIQSLSISCDKWSNMHSSDFNSRNVIRFEDPLYWLNLWFPESLTLKL